MTVEGAPESRCFLQRGRQRHLPRFQLRIRSPSNLPSHSLSCTRVIHRQRASGRLTFRGGLCAVPGSSTIPHGTVALVNAPGYAHAAHHVTHRTSLSGTRTHRQDPGVACSYAASTWPVCGRVPRVFGLPFWELSPHDTGTSPFTGDTASRPEIACSDVAAMWRDTAIEGLSWSDGSPWGGLPMELP